MAVLACAVVSVLSSAQQTAVPNADQTYTLQRVFKAGDVDRYRITVNQKANGPQSDNKDYQIKMVLVIKETTKTVGDSGEVTAVEEYTKADGTFGGQDMDMMQMMPKLTVTKDKAGKIDVTAEGGQEPLVQKMSDMAKSMMQSQAAMIPAKPVKVGDTWNVELPGVTPGEDTMTKFTVKLDGIEVVDGAKTLRLKTITDTTGGPQSDTKMHGEGTMYVDAASGKLIKMASKVDGTAKGSKINSEVTFEKAGPEDLKPKKKAAAPK
jgi:hypothetical protein